VIQTKTSTVDACAVTPKAINHQLGRNHAEQTIKVSRGIPHVGTFAVQKELYEKTGQKRQRQKLIMLISCADSRVDPSDIFHDRHQVQMFVLRNVRPILLRAPTSKRQHRYGAPIRVCSQHLESRNYCCDGTRKVRGGSGSPRRHLQKAMSRMDQLLNASAARIWREFTKDETRLNSELEGVRQSLHNLMSYDFYF